MKEEIRKRKLRTRLYAAIENEKCTLGRIRRLIADGALEASKEDDWRERSPLYLAAQAGRMDVVQLLLEAGEDPTDPPNKDDVRSWDKKTPRTALSVAALWGHTDIVQMLLDAGKAAKKRPDLEGALCSAVYAGRVDLVRLFLEAGAAVDPEPDEESCWRDNETPLSLAIKTERRELLDLLLDAGANINRNTGKNTPLCLAARANDLELMQHLIDRGADVNGATEEYTPLIAAAKEGFEESVRFLLAHGADVNLATQRYTPLAAGAWVRNDRFVPIARVLLEAGADVNRVAGNYTPLIDAAEAELTEGVRLLLEAGADPNKPTRKYTPLIAAAEGNNTEVTRMLLDAGADVNLATEYATPLIAAAYDGYYIENLHVLLAAGADVNAVANGKNARENALDEGNVRGAHVLRLADAQDHPKTIFYKEHREGLKPKEEHLAEAITNGCSAEEFRKLIRNGLPKVKELSAEEDAPSPLYLAAQAGRCDLVQILLEAGADVFRRTWSCDSGSTPRTALSIAARHGHIDVVRQLMDSKPDPRCLRYFPEVPDKEKIGEEEWQKRYVRQFRRCLGFQGALSSACLAGHGDIVRLILEAGADVDLDAHEYLNDNPLTLAIKGERWEVIDILLEAGADVNWDHLMDMPLGVAARTNNVKLMEHLIAHGAKINPKLRRGFFDAYTPLISAADEGGEESVRFLLDHGADVNAKTRGTTPLIEAMSFGREGVVRLLLAAGADVNAVGRFHTPLSAAAESGDPTLVRMLLDAGADPNLGAERFTNPLIAAAEIGHEEIARMLLAAGADVNAATDNKTPLIVAAGQIRESIVQLMLDHGADVNAVAGGETALMNALEQNRLAIARLLRRAGAVDISTQFVWNK